jgi:transcriptional regulator with XRE-family HTH domain
MGDETEAFRVFLADWLDRTGWSQFQLAMATGIGQSIISRWLSPDVRRRTQPNDATLKKLAPVVGRPFEDLMRMAGRLPDVPVSRSQGPDLPPELASLLADLETGWLAADPHTRSLGGAVVRAAFHTPRGRNRAKNNGPSKHELPSDDGLDHPKK